MRPPEGFWNRGIQNLKSSPALKSKMIFEALRQPHSFLNMFYLFSYIILAALGGIVDSRVATSDRLQSRQSNACVDPTTDPEIQVCLSIGGDL